MENFQMGAQYAAVGNPNRGYQDGNRGTNRGTKWICYFENPLFMLVSGHLSSGFAPLFNRSLLFLQ